MGKYEKCYKMFETDKRDHKKSCYFGCLEKMKEIFVELLISALKK